MAGILVDYVRISGLRGLKEFTMPLKRTPVLTGINNVGKTSILKALQIAFGSRAFLESDDFHIATDGQVNKIKNGRASCRERVCQEVELKGVGG